MLKLSICVSYLSNKAIKAYVKKKCVCFFIDWLFEIIRNIQKKVKIVSNEVKNVKFIHLRITFLIKNDKSIRKTNVRMLLYR